MDTNNNFSRRTKLLFTLKLISGLALEDINYTTVDGSLSLFLTKLSSEPFFKYDPNTGETEKFSGNYFLSINRSLTLR